MHQNSSRLLEINSFSVAEYEYANAVALRCRFTSQNPWFRNSTSSFLLTFRDFWQPRRPNRATPFRNSEFALFEPLDSIFLCPTRLVPRCYRDFVVEKSVVFQISVFLKIVRKIRVRVDFGAFLSPLDLPECGPCGGAWLGDLCGAKHSLPAGWCGKIRVKN